MVQLNAQEFTKICRELYSINETVTIQASSDQVKFSVEGDVGSGLVSLAANDGVKKEDQTILEVSQGVTQQFALRYLNMFNKASTLSTHTRLCLHAEQPLVVEYHIDDLGVLKYFLAPKISDDQ